jgi:hypothetical protein
MVFHDRGDVLLLRRSGAVRFGENRQSHVFGLGKGIAEG